MDHGLLYNTAPHGAETGQIKPARFQEYTARTLFGSISGSRQNSEHGEIMLHASANVEVHHHSFNVSLPLEMGRTAPMFVLSFFLHSILFAGSALDSFQCLRSLLIVSFHVFFGLPRPRCPLTSNSLMLLIQPSFLTTCPNQRSRLYRNKVCMLLIPSFLRR